MKILRQVLFVIVYPILILAIFLISMLLNKRGNFVFGIINMIIGIGCIVFGLIIFIKENKEKYSLFILGGILISCIYFIQYKNLQILKENPKAVTVFDVAKDRMTAQKMTDMYKSIFKTFKYKNITVYYHPSLEPALKLIRIYLIQAEEDTSKVLSNIASNSLTIYLDYDENVFKKLEPNLVNSQGFYIRAENRINILVKDCYEDILSLDIKNIDFKDTLMHEYCHYKLKEFIEARGIAFDKVPAWINEGLASYVGLEGASQIYQPKSIMPFNQLMDSKEWMNQSNKTKGEVYVQAHYAVSQLILSKGEKIIEELLLSTKELTFENSFKKVIGLSIEDYQMELKKDMKNGWSKYYSMIPLSYPKDISKDKISCLEQYVNLNPFNEEPLFDLSNLYSSVGDYEKARLVLNEILDKEPENSKAWRRLAFVLQNLSNFEDALKAYEKELSISNGSYESYMNMAQLLLLTDIDKAAKMAERATWYRNSKYVLKQETEIKKFIGAIKNGTPYEGCLELIVGDSLASDNLKKALVQKIIKEYPSINNKAREELERIQL